jgi:hypothetical protein
VPEPEGRRCGVSEEVGRRPKGDVAAAPGEEGRIIRVGEEHMTSIHSVARRSL